MAQINTTITFTDGVSSALKAMNQNLNQTAKGFESISGKIVTLNSLIQMTSMLTGKINQLARASEQMVSKYQYQTEQETKLTTIMRQRMNATNAEIQSIKDYANEQQKLGIYSDELILQGAQELASFTSNTEAIKTLIPAMNNLIAQQYGYTASGQQFQSTADMMGKVLSGQTGALQRLGYVFSEEEKAMLKNGDEMQRASVLAKIITDNVGDMNRALAGGSFGSMQNLSNSLGDVQEQLGKTLLPFKQFFNMVTMQWKIRFYESIIKGLQFVQNHINGIVIALGSLVVGLTSAGVAFMILQRKAIASAIATAVAWAVAHGPMLAIIGIIALVITSLGLLVAYSEKTFSAIGKFIGEFSAGAINSFIAIRNFVATLGEFIVNTFWKALDKVTDFFLSLFQNIISIASPLIEGIGKLFGQNWSDNLVNFQNKIEDIKNKGTLFQADFGRAEYVDVHEYGQKGAEIGASLSTKIQSQIDKLTGGLKKAVSDGFMDADNNKYDSNGALLVKDTSQTDIAEDYNKLLSEKATEKFGAKYSNIEIPSIEIKVEAKTDANPNEIASIVANTFKDAIQSSLQGVY